MGNQLNYYELESQTVGSSWKQNGFKFPEEFVDIQNRTKHSANNFLGFAVLTEENLREASKVNWTTDWCLALKYFPVNINYNNFYDYNT
jgi:hypothetical protein